MNTVSNNANINNISAVFFKYWPCILLLLAFAGFISKSLYNYPIGIMAVLGLYHVAKSTTPVWGSPKIDWNFRTASAVAGP